VFVWLDQMNQHLGRSAQAIIAPYVPNSTMYLTGKKDINSFGRIYTWDEKETACSDMFSGIGAQPGEGIVCLETQQRTLAFLLGCAREILHGLPLSGSQLMPAPEPPSLDDPSMDMETSSISVYASGSAYRLPVQFDVDYLMRFVEAQLDACQDHVWTLREDPAYFRDLVKEASEHRTEQLPTLSGSRHPSLDKPVFWERCIWTVVYQAYERVGVWSLFREQLLEVQRLGHEYEPMIAPDKSLPGDYASALSHLQTFAEKVMNRPHYDLRTSLPGSPPMRRFHHRLPQDPSNTIILWKSRPSKANDPYPEVARLWVQGLNDETQCLLMGRHNVMDEIDRLIRSDKREAALITPWVMDIFSYWAALTEIERQVATHQPRVLVSASLEHHEIEEKVSEKMRLFEDLTNVAKKGEVLGIAESGTPKAGLFVYPSDKKPSAVNISQMRKAEAELDAFWADMDSAVKRRLGKSLQEHFKGHLPERQVTRTPEWVEPVKSEKSDRVSVTQVHDRFALLDLQARTESTVAQSASATKRKAKTKKEEPQPEPIFPLSKEKLVPEISQPEPPRPVVPVSKRAYKAFSRIFYTPSRERDPGEVPWQDFLHAMTSIGCAAKRQVGSMWTFSVPPELGGAETNSSIVFHEPHPSPNIPINRARQHGRRLLRKFGWNASMFVQE
jgi:hypothetical protein